MEKNFFETFMSRRTNLQLSENGAIGLKSTNNSLVDFNFKISSFRNYSDFEIQKEIEMLFQEIDPIILIKYLFYVRDVRGGLGERRLFRIALDVLSDQYPELALGLLPLIKEYGRWDDVFVFVKDGKKIAKQTMSILKITLDSDLKSDNDCSLLAKWMPSENASSKETRKLARKLYNYFGWSPKYYRKVLSTLRKKIKIVEEKMSANKWDEIEYGFVPSKATAKYSNAFYKHDSERYDQYLVNVAIGNAKINTTGLVPYEILHKFNSDDREINKKVCNIMWQSLIENGWKQDLGLSSKSIVVCDSSGSMYCNSISGTNVLAAEIAQSLAMYFSSLMTGPLKDKVIAFSENPVWIDLSGCNTLSEKYERMVRYRINARNTNIHRVFRMILECLTEAKYADKLEDCPENIIIISDMEFDAASNVSTRNYMTLFDRITEEYQERGFKVPKLIFWNVCSRSGFIPMDENSKGLSLISGFSANAIKVSMSEAVDPYTQLLEVVNSERYFEVGKVVSSYFETILDKKRMKACADSACRKKSSTYDDDDYGVYGVDC